MVQPSHYLHQKCHPDQCRLHSTLHSTCCVHGTITMSEKQSIFLSNIIFPRYPLCFDIFVVSYYLPAKKHLSTSNYITSQKRVHWRFPHREKTNQLYLVIRLKRIGLCCILAILKQKGSVFQETSSPHNNISMDKRNRSYFTFICFNALPQYIQTACHNKFMSLIITINQAVQTKIRQNQTAKISLKETVAKIRQYNRQGPIRYINIMAQEMEPPFSHILILRYC